MKISFAQPTVRLLWTKDISNDERIVDFLQTWPKIEGKKIIRIEFSIGPFSGIFNFPVLRVDSEFILGALEGMNATIEQDGDPIDFLPNTILELARKLQLLEKVELIIVTLYDESEN